MARLLRYGELPLVILSALSAGPRSAYQLMLDAERQFGGRYKPSTGALYPAVAGLESAGLIAADREEGSFVLTAAGWTSLAEHEPALAEIAARTGASVLPEDRLSRRLREFALAVHALADRVEFGTLEAVLDGAVASLRASVQQGSHRVPTT